MGYFRELPDLDYLSFLPNRQNSDEYVRAKNLFRRPKLRDDISNPLIVFDKYIIPDGYRPDNVAEELYGSAQYDWIVLISAGITNIRDEWPLSDNDVFRYASKKYGNDLFGIHHYETKEQKDSAGRVVLDGGRTVTNTIQIPYPSYEQEITTENIFTTYDTNNPVGIFNDRVTGNLFVNDVSTITTTENYGAFIINYNSDLSYGGTWTYILNENIIESNQNFSDKISFLSKDGYFKSITVNTFVDEEGIPTLSYNDIDSSQQSYITFYDNKTSSLTTRTNITVQVTNYGNEILNNNRKREINVLKPIYVRDFIRDTRSIMRYKKSSQLITVENGKNIIRTENTRLYDSYGRTFERPNPTEVIINQLV